MHVKFLRDKKIDRNQFATFLEQNLPPEKYFGLNAWSITYRCLCLLKGMRPKKSEDYVNTKAKEILSYFYELPEDDDNYDYSKAFVRELLDLKRLPLPIKLRIETGVKKDLKDVENLIEYYHSTPFIASYLDNRSSPRNHEQKTILEFYSRTIKKREEILNYLTNSLEKRAIARAKEAAKDEDKANILKGNLKQMYIKYLEYEDFPYRDTVYDLVNSDIKYVIDFERLDHRRINVVFNKAIALGLKYDSSEKYKSKFFQKITRLNFNALSRDINRMVNTLPVIKTRRKTFQALRSMFLRKQWYGYYALALPQIEGLFAEMIKITKTPASLTGTLTDKVQLVRPFHENSKYSFDYYEYHIPNERNQFMHYGKIDTPKQKSQILLLDLYAILKTCAELNSPLIQLNNLIHAGASAVTDVGKLSNFLYLVKSVQRANLYDEISEKCDKFALIELLPTIGLERFFNNLETDFSKAYHKYAENIELFTEVFGGQRLKLNNISNKDFKSNIKVLQDLHNAYSVLFQEDLKLLIDTNYVLSNFGKLFALPKEIKSAISTFVARHHEHLKIINTINKEVKIDIPDDFLLTRKDLLHSLPEAVSSKSRI